MSEGIITIKEGRTKSIERQHPWIFSGGIEKAKNAVPGEVVTVTDYKNHFLGRGYWNPKSQIQVRILTWKDEAIDTLWWGKMLRQALEGRRHRFGEQAAWRWVNAESDFIPGLIVDYYAGWVVIQALTLYIDQQKRQIAEIIASLDESLNIQGVFERSDVDVRGKEGLRAESSVLWGKEPPEHILIHFSDTVQGVDVRHGHKTGTYLDQQQNAMLLSTLVREHFAGKSAGMLNCFSFAGSFSLAALRSGIGHVTSVDSSADALALLEQNLQRNADAIDFTRQVHNAAEADVFEYLRRCVARNDRYEIVVLDPPKFAHNAQQVDKAARGYKDLNLNAFKIVQSGGYLMTFSCSGAISPDLFQKIVFGAVADSGRQAQIVKYLHAADDHPIALTFPEGEYLKGLLLRVY